jgi:hypothetical protein
MYKAKVAVTITVATLMAAITSISILLKRVAENGGPMSLRGAGGDEAISYPGKDCFALLAMT